LAAGGNAGTFHLSAKRDESSRKVGRVRKGVIARGKKLLKKGKTKQRSLSAPHFFVE
jgi:hypothetical protein